MNKRVSFFRQVGRRIGEAFLRDELDNLRNLQHTFLEAYQWGPGVVTPEMTIQAIKEYAYDPQLYDYMLDNLLNWETVSGTNIGANENMRLRMVSKARMEYASNSVVARIIDLWTDFGFGINVDISPRDPKASDLWDTFWENPSNQITLGQREIKALSTEILNDGEVYFSYFVSKQDGTVIIRTIPTEEIIEPVSVATDKKVVGYWKREFIPDGEAKASGATKKVIYYRDWLAEANGVVNKDGKLQINPLTKNPMVHIPKGSDIADQMVKETDVFIMQVKIKPNKNNRGLPLLGSALSWADVYTGFAKDRAAVSKSVAMYVDKIKANTGQRGINMLKARIGTTMGNAGAGFGVERNPTPPRGSTWLENESATRTRMPLGTGASDAFKDAGIILNMLGLAGAVYPHWLGLGDSYRLATATAMEMPMLKAFERYQSFWASVWADMVKIVLSQAEKYGSVIFEDKTADVNQDSIIDFEVETVISVMDEVADLYDNGIYGFTQSQELLGQLLRVALQGVGIKKTDELLDIEKFDDTPKKAEDIPEETTNEVLDGEEETTEEALLERARLVAILSDGSFGDKSERAKRKSERKYKQYLDKIVKETVDRAINK